MPEPRTTLDLLLGLLADTGSAPTPAQVRAALREASPEQLVALTGAARTLAAALETAETTTGTLARTRGADDAALAAATGRTVRTLQRRYPKRTLRVSTPGLGQLDLLAHDTHGHPRPLQVELDLATTRLHLATTPVDPDGAVSGALLRWPLPLLTGAGGTHLLQALTPHAQRILIGADLDPGTATFTLDADARAAAEEIARICEHAAQVYPCLREQSAQDYFASQDPAAVATALGLPPGAGPEQVTAAAQLATENALRQLVLLTGVEAYLAGPRHTPPPVT